MTNNINFGSLAKSGKYTLFFFLTLSSVFNTVNWIQLLFGPTATYIEFACLMMYVVTWYLFYKATIINP